MPQPLPFSSFLKRLLIYSAIIGILAFAARAFLPPGYVTPVFPFLFVFFILITITGYWLLIRSIRGKAIRFINNYLLVTVVKLLLFIIILAAYLWVNKQDAVPFGVLFLILYLLFTVFEVVSLVNTTRNSGR